MAHKRIQSTMCYVRASEEKVDKAFDKIGELWSKNRVKSVPEEEPFPLLNSLNQLS